MFYLEDRAVERLEDLMEYWMPYVDDTAAYPNDVTFTEDELEIISRYRPDFVSQVSEKEGTWIKNGGPTDEEWNEYLTMLRDSCGMDKLLTVYQDAYTRYLEAQKG